MSFLNVNPFIGTDDLSLSADGLNGVTLTSTDSGLNAGSSITHISLTLNFKLIWESSIFTLVFIPTFLPRRLNIFHFCLSLQCFAMLDGGVSVSDFLIFFLGRFFFSMGCTDKRW